MPRERPQQRRRRAQPQPARQPRHSNQPSEGSRARSRTEKAFKLPASVIDELRESVREGSGNGARAGRAGQTTRASRAPDYLERRLTAAAEAYERDRYEEALRTIRPVTERAPDAPAVKELYGLILYRMGRWRQAAKQLRELHEITGSFDQHPVIADCERALGRLEKVKELWDELRRAGVDRDVLVEGRLVMAGALADKDELGGAIKLLEPEGSNKKHPDLCHVRQWYALADLYERAGDLPRARQLFARVAHADPDVLDAPARLAALS